MLKGQFRMTPGQFQELARLGIYQDRKVELLGGIVFEMTPNPPHYTAMLKLIHELPAVAPAPAWFVAQEAPTRMGKWIPAPDVTVFRGDWRSYLGRLPRGSEAALIVEVSDSTYPKNRRLKYRKYASRRIPAYWIVDLNGRAVEVHSEPFGSGRAAGYRQAASFGPGGRVPVVLDGVAVGSIAVDDILP